MDISDITAVAAAVGGVEGIIHLGKWWMSRRATVRQDNATATAAENANDRAQVDWLDKRLAERDAKIDAIYAELRAEQRAHLEDIHRLHETELRLAEAEVRKCHKRGCGDRQPPSEY